jgi:hypothetical protein
MPGLSLHFPADAVVCRKGDYLFFNSMLYYVEDILEVQLLVPAYNDPSVLLVQDSLSDSAVSSYHGEVYLLLSNFITAYENDAAVRKALREQTLQVKETGLLRPARMFPRSSCTVISGP